MLVLLLAVLPLEALLLVVVGEAGAAGVVVRLLLLLLLPSRRARACCGGLGLRQLLAASMEVAQAAPQQPAAGSARLACSGAR